MTAAPVSDLRLLEDAPGPDAPPAVPWRVLVVDDDPEVHAVTRMALRDCTYDGRALEILSAHGSLEARRLLVEHPDVALILLDVVMETEHAGLEFVRHVRDTLGNRAVRIVLRTGQPGQAPAREVVAQYEIDDYRTKTELTFERLNTLVLTALRGHQLLRQLEAQKLALQQSNHELERFAYVASHDLQTPLRSIIGFAQLLQRRVGAELAPPARELLDSILASGRELHTLITDLLQFSRLGREGLVVASVALDGVVQRTCARLHSVIAERGAQVDAGPLPTLRGSTAQLEQLFANLIENAIKFQPGPSPRVEIGAVRQGPEWEIRVSDHGIGIEPQYLDRIFEPFRRLHTSDEYPGSGIGLAICRKVVQLHRGSLRAESVPGQGTTFVIRLPV